MTDESTNALGGLMREELGEAFSAIYLISWVS